MKLSIIIPVYNQEELIIRCLDSIPARNDIEIIIIDDKSTDKTRENIMRYMLQYEDKKAIMLIENETNVGAGLSRNYGIDNAKGEYIMFLDSDDYLYTEEFDKVFNMLNNRDIIYYGLRTNKNNVLMPTPRNKVSLCGTVKIIKRRFIGNTRYPDKRFAEDYDFNLELLKKQPSVKYSNVVLLHYNSPRENSLFDIYGRKKGLI